MGSYMMGKVEALNWITKIFNEDDTCLDVGACDGVWAILIAGYLQMDACEIFRRNITEYDLLSKYRGVFACDIDDLKYEYYDLVIFGDVLEHMSVEKAQRVLRYALPRCKDVLVALPFQYHQGEIYGNPYEVHIQDDLTPDLIAERYPELELLYDTGCDYAYYHKRSDIRL